MTLASRTKQRDIAGGTTLVESESHSHMIGDNVGQPHRTIVPLKCMAL